MSPQKPLAALLLDDDPSQAYLLSRILEDVDGLDFELTHYTTSQRAMPDLLTQKADIVFLDHHLCEDRTGLDLLKALRDFGFDGPIVMLTGNNDDELVASFRRFGADAFVCKSELDAVRLAAAIRVALRLPHKVLGRVVPDESKGERRAG